MATTRINVSLSDDMLKYFDELSDNMGLSRNAVIVMALKNYIDQQKSLELTALYQIMQKLQEQEVNSALKNNDSEN